jgi:hypothetical protein
MSYLICICSAKRKGWRRNGASGISIKGSVALLAEDSSDNLARTGLARLAPSCVPPMNGGTRRQEVFWR